MRQIQKVENVFKLQAVAAKGVTCLKEFVKRSAINRKYENGNHVNRANKLFFILHFLLL